jgi:hypothetical protein
MVKAALPLMMHYLRQPKATYVAAFLLGALLALVAVKPARAAETFRLDRIAIVQFSLAPDNQLQLRHGILSVDGQIAWRASHLLPRPVGLRPEALNRPLVRVDSWLAYYNLGYGAVSAFELLDGSVKLFVGDDAYFAVAPSPDALLANGPLINLSTRAHLPAGNGAAIAGFVIEDRARTVLIRAVGPTLRKFGVGAFVGNPRLNVTRQAQVILANDDWASGPEAGDIRRAAARVGAFALDEGSGDAASLVLLSPGAYSVHVSSADPNAPAGEVLIEIYPVPDDFFLTAARQE